MSKTARLILLPALLLGVTASGWSASASASAKVLLYHHVSSQTPKSTSVTPEVFESHLAWLEAEGYQVVALEQVVNALLHGGADFAPKTVAITFDDAYRSVLTEALPRLEARGWPFTVFVSTEFIEDGSRLYLSWDELRALETRGGTIANHGRIHEHMVRRHEAEDDGAWLEQITNDVMHAQGRLEAELEHPARIFAYPYGEFDEALARHMRSLGFIAFGQQSGPVGATTNPYAIPRFPFATGFDGLRGFAEKMRTEHLPLTDPPLPATVLAANAPAPTLQLTVAEAPVRLGALNCFVGGQPGAATIRWLNEEEGVFAVTAKKPLRPGRTKYTCTAPHLEQSGVYFWHTHLWIKPNADGSWYEG